MSEYRVRVNDKEYEVTLLRRTDATVEFLHNGRAYSVNLERTSSPVISAGTGALPLPATSAKPKSQTLPGEVVSPMPGRIVKIEVAAGSPIKMGDTLVVMEAMKMENNIPSPGDGIVEEVLISAGQEVEAGVPLVRLKS